MTPEFQMKLLSSLAKVFPEEEPVYRPECLKLTALKNETVSFQAAVTCSGDSNQRCKLVIHSPIQQLLRARSVELVPVGRAAREVTDDNYLKTESGLYPDLLRELDGGRFSVYSGKWRSIWLDVATDESTPAGTYPIEIRLETDAGEPVCSARTDITIYDAVLPQTALYHTEWFHTDCLADYYHVAVFSEEHWQIIENFLEVYVLRGGNMILTPIFTPPLDTAVGGERTTVQLVEITVENGVYHFQFDRLKRWVDLCLKHGIQFFEMAHLFTQWGATCAPKIVARVDGKEEKLFGWHTPAVGEYTKFLQAFLPALTGKLEEWGIGNRTFFHVSDEPGEHFETFKAAKESLGELLAEYPTLDALSDYNFYRHGLVDHPIPGSNEIEPFLENHVPHLWTYYCCGQYLDVSNRFMAMPSARNRIYGTQLFKFDIEGILHWGFNFYNTQNSLAHINPYEVTDAGFAFPAGDPFLVYPGADRRPEESIRGMVFYQALTDYRALKRLEAITSKEYVLNLMEEDLADPITFRVYPKSDLYLLQLRNRVNREIARRV